MKNNDFNSLLQGPQEVQAHFAEYQLLHQYSIAKVNLSDYFVQPIN